MTYVKFNYSSYSRSIAIGVDFENTTFSAPISEWSWISEGDHLRSKISSFDPLFQEWVDREVSYYGDYVFTDDGLLIEGDSRISRAKFEDQFGSFEITFDSHPTWTDLDYSGIKESIYAANNVFIATVNDDIIFAGNGDDILAGGGGDDILRGQQGIDIAVFPGSKEGYSLKLSSQFQLIVTDIDSSNQYYGIDKLTGIEVVSFDNQYFDMSDLRVEALLNSPTANSMYVNRLFNGHTGRHLFSANQSEIDYLVGGGQGWVDEGISYSTPQSPTAEVYRFYVSEEDRHFYTANQSERDSIIENNSGFVYEGVAYYAYGLGDHPLDAIPVIRYFNPVINSHLYSTSFEEQSVLANNSEWINEGLAWYGDSV